MTSISSRRASSGSTATTPTSRCIASCAARATAASWSCCSTSRRCRARAIASACPTAGFYREVFNSDSRHYRGSQRRQRRAGCDAEPLAWMGLPLLRGDHAAAAGRRGACQPGMKVLFATSEVAPLVKTGGLADVSGALPAALQRPGRGRARADAGLSVPRSDGSKGAPTSSPTFDLPPLSAGAAAGLGSCPPACRCWCSTVRELFARTGGPYQQAGGEDWPDNDLRFGLLSLRRGAAGATPRVPLDWRPDVLHCNDWQTGLAPAYLALHAGRARAHGDDDPQSRLPGHLSAARRCRAGTAAGSRSRWTAWSSTATCPSSRRACSTPIASPR